jgi:UDP-N-acetyl-D-glucosamine/UDP-N-acetyl-D-galactosamine dehydrogenase
MFQSVAVVGLGYVGLPLAVAFGRHRPTIGFDLNETKLAQYRAGTDPSGEVSAADLAGAGQLLLTSDPEQLSRAEAIVVVVPTPIDDAHQPDLQPLKYACRLVAENMSPGTTVIFESTVYPGCTEEVCVPLLEQVSGFSWRSGERAHSAADVFQVGYSPERINPGDKEHRLETVVKVVSGDSEDTLEKVAALYEAVVAAGVHRAPSIKVAEAAKVIENTQRDLNIALMNELALIFHRLDIDTLDVLEAAGTKWNFLPFRPGLVGGHCIGVDPYYLTYKAEAVGHHPQVIVAGRQTNDGMGKFIAEQTVKRLLQTGRMVSSANVVVLGLTFKEDCPDLRNSRVIDVIRELQEYQCRVHVHDPAADPLDAIAEYGVELTTWDALPKAEAVVLAVPHREYREKDVARFADIMVSGATLLDVKSCLSPTECESAGIKLWRL